MHKKSFVIIGLLLVISVYFTACSSGNKEEISENTELAERGQQLFIQNCSACHNLFQTSIGPKLAGITDQVEVEWIRAFIKNPQSLIDAGDERAKRLFGEFKTYMPAFGFLPEEDIEAMIAFLKSQKSSGLMDSLQAVDALADPIPDSILGSGIVIELEQVAQIPPSSDKSPLARINKLDFDPSTGDTYILDLRGKLYRMGEGKTEVYLDMAAEKSKFIHVPGLGTGFGSFAFHPDFARNGLLYTSHTEPPDAAKADFAYADSIPAVVQWVLSEWKTGQPGKVPFVGESRELFRINMVTGIHGVQEITFNPLAKPGESDYGMLFISIGDGGSAENGYSFLLHNHEDAWGNILRIDPAGRNSANGKYGIPGDNPFTGSDNPKTLKEIYALGFRNPHRITWSASGQMLVTNIGHQNIESIYVLQPGDDCGWPVREGAFTINPAGNMDVVFALPGEDSMYHYAYPVAQYDHDEGDAISGGFDYTGNDVPALKGKYVFGDVVSGRLFFVEVNQLERGKMAPVYEWQVSLDGVTKPLREICDNKRVDLRFGKDAHGNLYVFTKADGKVYWLAGD